MCWPTEIRPHGCFKLQTPSLGSQGVEPGVRTCNTPPPCVFHVCSRILLPSASLSKSSKYRTGPDRDPRAANHIVMRATIQPDHRSLWSTSA